MESLEDRSNPGAGGGYTAGGIAGEYFANNALSGPASFTRQDVRIDFDWGSRKPGGSLSPQYEAVGATNFSARWTGQLVPKYTETYTFETRADDGIRLYLKSASATTWTTVIDNWPAGGQGATVRTGTFAMTAGQKYDVRVEYRQFAASAVAELRWSSPSTPKEVIEPLTVNGYHVDGRARYMFADMAKNARANWEPPGTPGVPAPAQDAAGNPLGDGALYILEGAPLAYDNGVYNVRFTGQANVQGLNAKIRKLGSTINIATLTPADAYNAATNVTEFNMVIDSTNNGNVLLRFLNTKPTAGSAVGTGIRNLEIMRPRTIGGSDSYPYGTLYADDFKEQSSNFSSYRWLDVNGNLTEREWVDRTEPGFRSATRGGRADDGIVQKNWTYEYQILYANETGKDLHITVPALASNDYFLKLARLIRYGSDANGVPYTTATTNPVYPPLNPNLKAYIELSNEVWNGSLAFGQTRQLDDEAVAASQAATGTPQRAEWDIANYDGSLVTTDDNGYGSYNIPRLTRWYALRTARMSEQVRSVFGTSMGDDARILMFWQYNNSNNIAHNELKFLDDYFNNGDGNPNGQARPTPRPVSYYLWGAGGAAYYGSGNPQGRLATNPITNAGFDLVNAGTAALPLDAATPRPTNVTGWAFTGNAGVYGKSTTLPPPPAPQTYQYSPDGQTFTFYQPNSGNYAAYLARGATVTRSITFAEPGRYVVGFAARGTHTIPLDFTLDGTRVTPVITFGTGALDPATTSRTIPSAFNLSFTGAKLDLEITTASIQVDVPAGGRTVTFRIAADPVTAAPGTALYDQQRADVFLIDDMYVGSIDRLFEGGLPNTGQALGQVASGTWTNDRRQTAQLAHAYGLKPAIYEAGWSLGGDNGSSPLQNWAKYRDPRAKTVNNTFNDILNQAGYGLVQMGVYEQWPDWDLGNAANYPLLQSQIESADKPPLSTNGLHVPLVLSPANFTLRDIGGGATPSKTSFSRAATEPINMARAEWVMWNAFTGTGTQTIAVDTTGAGGTVKVTVDEAVVATGASGGTITANVPLTRGLHTIKVRSTGTTAFNLTQVRVTGVTAPDAPIITSANPGNGTVALAWGAVSGATGYRVRWGTTPGDYTSSTLVTGTSFTVTSLTNGTPYYFAIGSRNATGESLPSIERAVIPPPTSGTGRLAVWEMNTTRTNPATTAAPIAVSSQVIIGSISRGAGLNAPGTYWQQNTPYRVAGIPNGTGGSAGATLADAISRNAYFEFTVAAVPGRSLSLSSVSLQAWASLTTTAEVGMTYSTGGAFTPIAIPGLVDNSSSKTVDLSGIATVQGTAATVTFRVYVFKNGANQPVGIGLGTTESDLVVTGSTAVTLAGPTTVAARGATSTSVSVTWSDVANETGYRIDRRPASGTWATIGTVGANVLAYTDTAGLTAGVQYEYRVASVAGSVVVIGDNDFAKLVRPVTGLAVSGVTGTTATVGWNPVAEATRYRVFRFNPATSQWVHQVDTTSTSYTLTGLAGGTTHRIRVFADHLYGAGDSSFDQSDAVELTFTTP
jgi:hypothetical protein